jgi:hypothetical protein
MVNFDGGMEAAGKIDLLPSKFPRMESTIDKQICIYIYISMAAAYREK